MFKESEPERKKPSCRLMVCYSWEISRAIKKRRQKFNYWVDKKEVRQVNVLGERGRRGAKVPSLLPKGAGSKPKEK